MKQPWMQAIRPLLPNINRVRMGKIANSFVCERWRQIYECNGSKDLEGCHA